MSPLASSSTDRKPPVKCRTQSVITVTEIPVERTDGGAVVVCGTSDTEDF